MKIDKLKRPRNGNGNGKHLPSDLRDRLQKLNSDRDVIAQIAHSAIDTTEASVRELALLRSITDRALNALNLVVEEMEAQKKELDIAAGGSGNFNLKRIFQVAADSRDNHTSLKAEHDELQLKSLTDETMGKEAEGQAGNTEPTFRNET